MAENRCTFEGENCLEIPKAVCLCKDPPYLLCERHVVSHMLKGTMRDHTIKPIFAELDEQENLILEQARVRLIDIKNRAISEITQKHLSEIKEINKSFSDQLTALATSFEQIHALLQKSLASGLALRSTADDFLSKLKAVSDAPADKRENLLDTVLYRLLCSLGSLPSFVRQSLEINDLEENRFNYWFERNTKNLIEVDNETTNKTTILLDSLDRNLGDVAGICSLEDGQIFYCGGYINQNGIVNLSSCYKIDPKKKSFSKLADLPTALCHIIPTRIENDIYVFGGYNGSTSISESFKYSIKDNRWETIPSLPSKSFCTSSICVNRSLLLVGYSLDGIYEYKNNNYQKIPCLSLGSGPKVLLKNKEGDLFLLSDSKIYKSSEDEYLKWEQVSSYNGIFNSYIENSPELWGDYFCFSLWGNRYMRFNYKTLQLEVPALINT